MNNSLDDLPLPKLRKILRATERTAGPQSASATVIRRAVERKQQAAHGQLSKGGLLYAVAVALLQTNAPAPCFADLLAFFGPRSLGDLDRAFVDERRFLLFDANGLAAPGLASATDRDAKLTENPRLLIVDVQGIRDLLRGKLAELGGAER